MSSFHPEDKHAGDGSGKKNRIRMGANVGSSSILLIFVILCLISFATLSLVSANADWKLNRKIMDRTTSYYNACNQAEAQIAELDRQCREAYLASSSEAGYFAAVEDLKSRFAVPISDTQQLEVEVGFLYPQEEEDPFYRITSWKVSNIQDFEYHSTLPVFQ